MTDVEAQAGAEGPAVVEIARTRAIEGSEPLAPVFAEALAHVAKAQNLMSLASMPDIESADVSVIAQSAVVIEGETPADALLTAGVWARTMPDGTVITSMAWAQTPGTVHGEPDLYQLTLHLSFPDPLTREPHHRPGRVVLRPDGGTA